MRRISGRCQRGICHARGVRSPGVGPKAGSSRHGGDNIPARFMRQDFFEYTPQFKLIIAGNHKPGLRSVQAIRRHFNLGRAPLPRRNPRFFGPTFKFNKVL